MLLNNFYQFHIQHIGEQEADFHVHFNPDHEIYRGHFPGDPVVPGVCILQTSCELFSSVQKQEYGIVSLKNVKFMQVIRPPQNPDVTFKISWTPVEEGFEVKGQVLREDFPIAKYTYCLQKLEHI